MLFLLLNFLPPLIRSAAYFNWMLLIVRNKNYSYHFVNVSIKSGWYWIFYYFFIVSSKTDNEMSCRKNLTASWWIRATRSIKLSNGIQSLLKKDSSMWKTHIINLLNKFVDKNAELSHFAYLIERWEQCKPFCIKFEYKNKPKKTKSKKHDKFFDLVMRWQKKSHPKIKLTFEDLINKIVTFFSRTITV